MEPRNVDDLIAQEYTQNEAQPFLVEQSAPEMTLESPANDAPVDTPPEDDPYELPVAAEADDKQEVTPAKEVELDPYGSEVRPADDDDELVPKSVMRERLERKNRETEQRIADEVARARAEILRELQQQQAPAEHAENGESGDEWAQQLEQFILQTTERREQARAEQEWQAQARAEQAAFESKFNNSAARYKDFEQVVTGKPLTPQMVIATRGMDDPAAFIYAAAKTQAPELDRISRIQDPMSQAIELGRLEERMRKARTPVTNTHKPVKVVGSDVSEKVKGKRDIDSLVQEDERRVLKLRASNR
jgi:hypothetical protein